MQAQNAPSINASRSSPPPYLLNKSPSQTRKQNKQETLLQQKASN